MPGPPFVHGEAVDLHTIELDDAEELQRLVNDPRVRSGLDRYEPATGADEREWIESIGEDGDVHLAICVDGDLVGTIGTTPPTPPVRTGEVGYLLAPSAWGNGYATDALETFAAYAFDELGLSKLAARAYETNPASQRVLEKVGFVEEGVFREEALVDGERTDVHRYGLLADEFERSE